MGYVKNEKKNTTLYVAYTSAVQDFTQPGVKRRIDKVSWYKKCILHILSHNYEKTTLYICSLHWCSAGFHSFKSEEKN